MTSSPSQHANVLGSDYIYVLDQFLNQTTAPFIAIFEDDIVFADGWLSKTVQALTQLRTQSNS